MMKKFLFASLLLSSTLHVSAFADNGTDQRENPQPKNNHSRLFAAPKYERVSLDAASAGKFAGNTWGGEVGFEYADPWGIYAHVSAQAGSGKLYAKADDSTIDMVQFMYSQRLGYQLEWGEQETFSFTPYVGFDYLWWREHLDIVNNGKFQYTYQKPRIPFGAMVGFDLNSELGFLINYSYIFGIISHVNINVTEGSDWFLKRKNDQLLELSVIYRPMSCLELRLTPFYQYVGFGRSTARATSSTGRVIELDLPSESYDIWGGKIEVAYRF